MSRVIKEDDDVINYERTLKKPTTYLDDYKWPVLEKETDVSVKPKIKEPKKRIGVVDSFKVPFDFYFKPKVIDFSVKKALDELTKTNDESIAVRPRIYKCPEVSLDDIPDKNLRDLIIKFVYTSQTQNVMEEAMNAANKNKK